MTLNRRQAVAMLGASAVAAGLPTAEAMPVMPSRGLSAQDDAFLDDMQRRAARYFVEQAGAANGQVLDRARADNTTGKRDSRTMASIAATGFGLTALCVADKRGYLPRGAALAQARRTLRYHVEQMPHEHGFLYHFNDVERGTAFRGSEVSPIDTSLLLCGALTARAYFAGDAVVQMYATQLYERVDWPWMRNGGDAFAMGWKAGAFLPSRWNHYCELMMMVLLAMGSPTHPVEASAWDSFTRPTITYAGETYIGDGDPLFVHQYSHAWFDFRNRRDKYANYFENSIAATRAHRAFCLDLGAPYADDYWGISASDSAHGYTAWGGPDAKGEGFGGIDGSVVPNATAGSLVFAPTECLRVLHHLKTAYGTRGWGRYGFVDALHPAADWYDADVLGIDLGIGMLMAENLRTGFVWTTFAKNAEVQAAMQKAGFRSQRAA